MENKGTFEPCKDLFKKNGFLEVVSFFIHDTVLYVVNNNLLNNSVSYIHNPRRKFTAHLTQQSLNIFDKTPLINVRLNANCIIIIPKTS